MTCKLSQRVVELQDRIAELEDQSNLNDHGEDGENSRAYQDQLDELLIVLDRDCECDEVRNMLDKLNLLRRTL